MVKIVQIIPYAFDNTFIFLSMDQIGKTLMTSSVFKELETSSEDLVNNLVEYTEMNCIQKIDTTVVGDTIKIFYTPEFTYKMIFVEGKHISKDQSKYNLITSMLHTEGKKLYYNGVIVKLNNKDEYCDITKEEVISLIERRRVHKGIKINQTKVQEVEIDNNWNCDVSLREFKKKICTVSGYFLIILSKDDDFDLSCTSTNSTKYIFSFVDKYRKTMGDFYKKEYEYLLTYKDTKEVEADNPFFYLQYLSLLKSNLEIIVEENEINETVDKADEADDKVVRDVETDDVDEDIKKNDEINETVEEADDEDDEVVEEADDEVVEETDDEDDEDDDDEDDEVVDEAVDDVEDDEDDDEIADVINIIEDEISSPEETKTDNVKDVFEVEEPLEEQQEPQELQEDNKKSTLTTRIMRCRGKILFVKK